MWTYTNTYELYHYGILGQKWGVRRYQNEDGSLTKAGKNRQSKRDKRASKYIAKADRIQKDIDKLQSKNKQSKHIQRKIEKLEQHKEENLKDAETKKQGKLTRKEKYMIAGAAVAAAYATYIFLDSGGATRLIEKGKAALGKDISFNKNTDLARQDLSADQILDKVVKRINPGYGQIGTTNNCKRCTYAYEMSRRGFDVKATNTLNGIGQNIYGTYKATHKKGSYMAEAYKKIFDTNISPEQINNKFLDEMVVGSKNIAKKTDSYAKDIFSKITENPNNARGELSVMWNINGIPAGGHSMAWEIINNNPIIFDCQTGDKYNMESFKKEFDNIIGSASITRLDNIDLNDDFLLRWVRNA